MARRLASCIRQGPKRFYTPLGAFARDDNFGESEINEALRNHVIAGQAFIAAKSPNSAKAAAHTETSGELADERATLSVPWLL